MCARLLLLLGLAAATATATGHAASPDDPGARVPEAGYRPITAGTKRYRPLEPLPWGQVNRRVMPKDAQAPEDGTQPAPPEDKAGPGQLTPQQKR